MIRFNGSRLPALWASIAACVVMIPTVPALSAVYYVRESGSDSNNGLTSITAWRTIQKAAEVASLGDIVYVGAGTYDEEVEFENSGLSTLIPIQFIADTSGLNTGDPGAVIVTKSNKTIFDIDDVEYIRFVGFQLQGGKDSVRVKESTGIEFGNCVVSGDSKDGFDINESQVTLTGCRIFNCNKSGIHLESDASATITLCEIFNNGDEGILSTEEDLPVVITQCKIYGNGEEGIELTKDNGLVVNCLIYDNGKSGVMVRGSSGPGASFWHCTIVSNDEDGFQQRGGDVTIKNCIIAFNGDDGIDQRNGADSMTHTYNIVFGNAGSNFNGVSQSTGELVTDPLFTGNPDYRLLASSPAIDSGTDGSAITNIDIDGTTRPIGVGWDMGCYEGSPTFLFTDVSTGVGFNVQTTSGEGFGSGLHWADIDTDGDLDAVITGDSAKLITNNSGTSFFVSTFGGGNTWRQGSFADFDNDGDLDFWASTVGSANIEHFFENDGNGVFTDIGDLGFSQPSDNEGCGVADINWDGWCDVVTFSGNFNWLGMNQADDPLTFVGFSDLSYGMNLPGDFGNRDYCSTADVNNDGHLDFFTHWGGGRLLLSEGDGTYRKQLPPNNINIATGNDKKVGSAWGDYNNDGRLDLFVPMYDDLVPGYLWTQQSDGTFLNLAATALILDVSEQRSCTWGDYDNDGHLDLYITTRNGASNKLYHNLGNGTFELASEGADASGNNHDAVFVDFDNDGDLDIAVTREGDTNILLRNNLVEVDHPNKSKYLKILVRGAGGGSTNVAAVGTRIELYNSSGTTLIARRDVGTARGYGGSEPQWLHIGGIDPAATYLVRAYFLNGIEEETIVPQNLIANIGSTAIPQMLILEEDPPVIRVIYWRENDPHPR